MLALSPTDVAVFKRALCAISPLSEADLAEALALARPRELRPRQYLLRAGELATEVAVVVHGLMREHFVMSDGTERTKAFVPEGHPTGSLADVLSAVPSRAFIVAEEPTRVLVANFADTLALAEHCEGFRRYGERLTQRVLLVKAEREYELLGLDAQARYQAFLSRYPGLEARVAARHVASYLGITPVHLSRLRRRRRSEHAVGKAHTTTQTG